MTPPTEDAEVVAAGHAGPGDGSQHPILLPIATSGFLVVNLLDIALTVVLLYRGGHREANPIAEYILNHWGWEKMALFKLGVTVFVCLIAQYIARRRSLAAGRRLLIVVTIIVAAVVAYSVVLLVRGE